MKSLFVPIALAFSVAAHAGTIYDTYGPGESHSPLAYGVDKTQIVAMPFLVTTTSTFSQLTLSLLTGFDYTISLTYGGGTQPGSTLTSWNVTGGGTTSLTPSSTVTMTPGEYFIVASSSSSAGGWYHNAVSHQGDYVYFNELGWNRVTGPTSVMRIEAEAVPEPASLVALGSGFVLLARRRNPRKK